MSEERPTIRKPLVIGLGNRTRGDDAVGPIVAESVRARVGRLCRTIAADGDLSSLVLEWGPDQDVIVIDALRADRPAGTIITADGLGHRLVGAESVVSSHGIGLAEVVELARLLDRTPRSLMIFGVVGKCFDHGETLSEAVEAAVPDLVDMAARRCVELREESTVS